MQNDLLLSNAAFVPERFPGVSEGVSFPDSAARTRDEARWQSIIEQLLAWRGELVSAGEDRAVARMESALDFAVDHGAQPPPTCITLDDCNLVAFTWGTGGNVDSIEFVAPGVAELVVFRDGQVAFEATLLRNPQTRRLELKDGVD